MTNENDKNESNSNMKESELEIAIGVLCELRDLWKKEIFLGMMEEIKMLKAKLEQALDLAEYFQKFSRDVAMENDWLHSLKSVPASPSASRTQTKNSDTDDDIGNKQPFWKDLAKSRIVYKVEIEECKNTQEAQEELLKIETKSKDAKLNPR